MRDLSDSIPLSEAEKELKKTKLHVAHLINKLGDDFENVYWNHDDEDLDDDFLHRQYHKLFEKLEEFFSGVSYLERPIQYEGILHKNSSGRYQIGDGPELTSGTTVELLVKEHGRQYWFKTTIEHYKDYYAVGLGYDKSLEKMRARKR